MYACRAMVYLCVLPPAAVYTTVSVWSLWRLSQLSWLRAAIPQTFHDIILRALRLTVWHGDFALFMRDLVHLQLYAGQDMHQEEMYIPISAICRMYIHMLYKYQINVFMYICVYSTCPHFLSAETTGTWRPCRQMTLCTLSWIAKLGVIQCNLHTLNVICSHFTTRTLHSSVMSRSLPHIFRTSSRDLLRC